MHTTLFVDILVNHAI